MARKTLESKRQKRWLLGRVVEMGVGHFMQSSHWMVVYRQNRNTDPGVEQIHLRLGGLTMTKRRTQSNLGLQ
jgi:hypothetical protein